MKRIIIFSILLIIFAVFGFLYAETLSGLIYYEIFWVVIWGGGIIRVVRENKRKDEEEWIEVIEKNKKKEIGVK
jgi:hypothetical protein